MVSEIASSNYVSSIEKANNASSANRKSELPAAAAASKPRTDQVQFSQAAQLRAQNQENQSGNVPETTPPDRSNSGRGREVSAEARERSGNSVTPAAFERASENSNARQALTAASERTPIVPPVVEDDSEPETDPALAAGSGEGTTGAVDTVPVPDTTQDSVVESPLDGSTDVTSPADALQEQVDEFVEDNTTDTTQTPVVESPVEPETTEEPEPVIPPASTQSITEPEPESTYVSSANNTFNTDLGASFFRFVDF